MTVIEAVDEILQKAGLLPTGSLDTGGNSAAARAESILEERDIRVQKRPWRFNLRRNVTLTREGGTSFILVPAGVITINIDLDRENANRHMSQVGGRLYDLENNTFAWDIDLIVTYVLRYDFDCIPEHIAQYVSADAAVAFLERGHGHSSMLGIARQDRDRMRTEAYQIESDSEHINLLDTYDMYRVRGDRTREEGR